MAKQLVGPAERHLEKGIVGIAGLILIGVAVQYLITSPNRTDVDGEAVAPGEVYEKVARKATDVRQRIANARPNVELPEPVYDEFVSSLNPFEAPDLTASLPAAAPWAPEVPIIDPPGVIEGQRKLARVVKLPKPAVTYGRSTFEVYIPNLQLRVHNWVTVTSLFNREAQEKALVQDYGSAKTRIVFGPVQLQRRTRREDGSWSDADWEFVDTWPALDLGTPPKLSLDKQEDVFVVPMVELNDLDRFRDQLAEPKVQLDLIRKLMPRVRNGTKWTFAKLVPDRQLLLMDDEFLNPGRVEPPTELDDRYGLSQPAVTTPTEDEEEEPETTEQIVESMFEQGIRLLGNATTEAQATEAYNIFFEISNGQNVSPSDKGRAERLMAEADQKRRDIIRNRLLAGAQQSQTPSAETTEAEEERELLPRQQVWAHDAAVGSVQSGHSYQYRIRVLLLNTLAGEPGRFADPKDALTIFLEGEWSDPSDPVEMERESVFFATGADQRKRTVKVEFYQWQDGVWVTTRENFGIGDELKLVTRAPVPSLEDPKQPDRPKIAFGGNTTVLDVDFSREYRERNVNRDGTVTFDSPPDEVESAVFVDESGRLIERIIPADKMSPSKKSFSAMVWKPPR